MLVTVQFIGRDSTDKKYQYTTELIDLAKGDLVVAPVGHSFSIAKVCAFPLNKQHEFVVLKEIKQKVLM